jgi:NAD(P)-dependent dehydrogenase (short-subunit alcohol dehydrogenase family)
LASLHQGIEAKDTVMGILDKFRLEGKRALITGGSRGIGLEISRALGEAGAKLVLVGRDEANLEEARKTLVFEAPEVRTIISDIAHPEECVKMCERALAECFPIDILVNNVGGRRVNFPTEEMPLEEWQRIVDLNLTQAFICTKMIGGAMVKNRYGRIINVASISGLVAGKQMRGRSYETCKAGLIMFTKAVAADWAQYGVTVNAIAPGTFLTDANSRWFSQFTELKGQMESTIPMGRLGDPSEIAGLALYLASDASSYMTGSVVVIDGGRTLW